MAVFAVMHGARLCSGFVTARARVGCCWALIALLFVGGIMNVLWIAAITILVLAEKVVPGRRAIARIAGVGLFAEGVWVLTEALRTA